MKSGWSASGLMGCLLDAFLSIFQFVEFMYFLNVLIFSFVMLFAAHDEIGNKNKLKVEKYC